MKNSSGGHMGPPLQKIEFGKALEETLSLRVHYAFVGACLLQQVITNNFVF